MWENWLLDYLTTHPNAKMRYWQSDMQLIIHSDASFLVEWDAKSNYGRYFYIGWNQNNDDPQQINGAVDVSASLLPLVAISVAEAELGACRRFDSIQGRSTRRDCFSRPIPPETMRRSGLLIACCSANIAFSRLDEL